MGLKSAVVTGASGFIGNALSTYLLEQGIKVYGVYRNPAKVTNLIRNPLFVGIQATFNQYSEIAKAIDESVDVWFHLAFNGGFGTDSLKDYGLQLENTKIACDCVTIAAELQISKFVYASTVNEIEALGFLNHGFTNPRYTCIYSAGKLATEIIGKTLAHNYGIEFITGLIAMPYGENNFATNLPNIIMKQLNSGIEPKLIEGNNLYDLIYIDDVVRAFHAIGEKGANLSSYYVGHRKLSTFKDLMIQIRNTINPKIHMNFGIYPDAPALDYSTIDLDALYRDTRFECQAHFKESILKTAQWLKSIESKG